MIRAAGMAILCLGLAAGSAAYTAQPADKDPVMTAYRDAALAQVDRLQAAMPQITRSADAVAEKLLAGGKLYAGGQDRFMYEAWQRAGGFMMLDSLTETPNVTLSEKDVVLVGATDNEDTSALTACRRARKAGAHTVLFSPDFAEPKPPIAALCDTHIPNFAVGDAIALPGGKRAGATSGMFNTITLWTYTGEMFGALTRRGRTPVMYQSAGVPGGRTRNRKYVSREDDSLRRFHSDFAVFPRAEGEMGKAYLDILRRQLGGLRGVALDNYAALATAMADRVRSGGSIHLQTISHSTCYEVLTPGLPSWLKPVDEMSPKAPKPEAIAAPVKPGDIFFELGYQEPRPAYIKAVHDAGGKYAVAMCHAPLGAFQDPQPDWLLDAQWEYGDSALLVPGYDVRLLPTSAILQTVVFWTVIAKTQELVEK